MTGFESIEKSKHTPGPWKIYGNDTEIYIGNMESTNSGACDGIRMVCDVKQGDYELPDYDEAKSNATLIASAPEMFKTLAEARIALTFYREWMAREHPGTNYPFGNDCEKAAKELIEKIVS